MTSLRICSILVLFCLLLFVAVVKEHREERNKMVPTFLF